MYSVQENSRSLGFKHIIPLNYLPGFKQLVYTTQKENL